MKRIIILMVIMSLITAYYPAAAQVGIGTTNPDPSSMLDVTSASKGLLVPRMTFAERNSISMPASGLMVFCTNDNNFYMNKGTAATPSWQLTNTPWLVSGSDLWYTGGKIGVGTSPAWTLDVSGDINFSGSLRRNGLAVATGVSAVTATPPLYSSGGSTPNITMTPANGSTPGYLTPGDWNTFNSKQNALVFGNVSSPDINILGGSGAVIGSGVNMSIIKGNLSEISSSVLTITGGTNAVLGSGTTIQMKQAGASQPGYLSSADWNAFNNKIGSQWLNSGAHIYYPLGFVGIGMLNPPATNLHVSESTSDVIPGFRIEQLGTGDAAMEYRRIQSSVSSGIHAADNNAFKICGASTLMGPAYQTPDQLLRIHTQSGVDKGITDINHQSRVRAHLDIMANILPGIWTTIFFRSVDFDEHLEYIPQAGQFIARKDGYYQVNSRVEYNPSESFNFMPQGFVSIAIYKNSTSYAEGNNLQITDSQSNVFYHNNAPNVSDVLWLQAGDAVEIKTFQTYTMMPNPAFIQPNHEKTYFSIHKIS